MPGTGVQRRKLGMGMSTALVIGNMIGSGVFLLPASLAAYGGISIVAWLLTAAGAFLLAMVFARLGRAYPRTGGPYAYSRRAFGDFVGTVAPDADIDLVGSNGQRDMQPEQLPA